MTRSKRERRRNCIPASCAQSIRRAILAYWMPRDPIFAAYVNQWQNLLELSSERQANLARWMP
jgi:hypothetical protein